MKQTKYFIIDFDSTFTQVEALDVLAEIALKDNENQAKAIQEIKDITDRGMEGGISFRESLMRRIEILQANKKHLPELVERLSSLVSPSFKRNTEFIEKYKDQIFIISNGFKDFIVPIVKKFGIKEEHVFANEFQYGSDDEIVGFDETNLLSQNNGKPKQIESLKLNGEVFVLGDGYTDFEIKKQDWLINSMPLLKMYAVKKF